MVTIDASRTIISCATMTTARIPHRRGSGPVSSVTPADDAVTMSLDSTVSLSSVRPALRRNSGGRLGVMANLAGATWPPCPAPYRGGVRDSSRGECSTVPGRRLGHLDPAVAAAAPAPVRLAGPDLFDDLAGVLNVELVPVGP